MRHTCESRAVFYESAIGKEQLVFWQLVIMRLDIWPGHLPLAIPFFDHVNDDDDDGYLDGDDYEN